jgi:hypothetical protein
MGSFISRLWFAHDAVLTRTTAYAVYTSSCDSNNKTRRRRAYLTPNPSPCSAIRIPSLRGKGNHLNSIHGPENFGRRPELETA